MAKHTLTNMKIPGRPFARMVRDADRLCRRLRQFAWSADHEQILADLMGLPPKDATEFDRLAREGCVADVVDAICSTAFALQQFRMALSADYGGMWWFEATEGPATVIPPRAERD